MRMKPSFNKGGSRGGSRGGTGRGGAGRSGGMRGRGRPKNYAKYKMSADEKIDYKNVSLLQRFINDRGKIVSRRVSGVSASVQRRLTNAIKRARHLALLTTGGVKK